MTRNHSPRSVLASTDTRLPPQPQLLGVSTALSDTSYTQDELLAVYGIQDPRTSSIFRNSAIDQRFLTLPPVGLDGSLPLETQGQLLDKHRTQGMDMAARAIRQCLREVGAQAADIRCLCCVTSTGFLTPGFSALLVRELGLDPRCARLDVVGMGCNAGLNGMNATASWAKANPGRLAILVCVEVCSAAYVMDGTVQTTVVNSLFGDGAAAAAVMAAPGTDTAGPTLLRFSSLMIPEAIDAMRYEWRDDHGKFSFLLDREVPHVVGANAETALANLLADTGLRRQDIAHWLIHSGGKKVIDSVMINLGLTRHDVRHTTSVLRDYGNLSSGSFLFSYRRLVEEFAPLPGDYTVLMTMGPGSTIEMALAQW
jgi:3,5-dihydroxyphenylacetyl-CoA synthase